MDLRRLTTPTALVDLERVEANAAGMRARAQALGVALRPHVKTHKVPAIARIQHAGQAGPITVSTLAEARAFAQEGFHDLLWALPLPAGREPEALALTEAGVHLALLVDSPEAVARIGEAAQRRGVRARLHLKVDCGYGRAGVDPDSPQAVDLATRIHEHPALTLAGLLTHGGHAYACRGPAEVALVADQERDAVTRLASHLEAAGLPRPRTSVGSTPTAVQARDLAGIDEIRPGNYALFDAFQAAIGSCALEDCALTVLATVIGRYPARDALVLDAGALALSVDPGARHVDPGGGYGALFSEDMGTHHQELSLVALSQEHGKVRVLGGLRPGAFPLGSRLRVVPNHACLTAACHPLLLGVRGERVVERWAPVRGW